MKRYFLLSYFVCERCCCCCALFESAQFRDVFRYRRVFASAREPDIEMSPRDDDGFSRRYVAFMLFRFTPMNVCAFRARYDGDLLMPRESLLIDIDYINNILTRARALFCCKRCAPSIPFAYLISEMNDIFACLAVAAF